MDWLGLILLLVAGLVIGVIAMTWYTVYVLTHPPRRSYAYAVSKGLPSEPKDLRVIDLNGIEHTSIAYQTWEHHGGRVWDLEGLDPTDYARDLPLATLRVLDLARALAQEPTVLLLDEMTAALPANLAERVLDVIRRQGEAGRSVIFISHRMLEIAALCHRATVLRDGRTVGVVDIAPGAVDRLRAVAAQLMRESADYAAAVREFGGTPAR